MGATNCPETARQKMIGMMYLVLTAMLALNVSKDIINAFVTVGDAMVQTNQNFNKKIEDSYRMFNDAYTNNPEKVGENYQKAQKVKELTKEISEFIDNTKYEFVAKVEKLDKNSAEEGAQLAKELLDTEGINGISAKDEYSIGTRYFCGTGNEDGVGYKATELKNKMEEYKKALKEILGEDASQFNLGLITDGDYHDLDNSSKKLTWERYNFYNTIAVADVVILNRIKAEVLNAEFDVVNHLFRAVSRGDLKFEDVTAKVIPTSKYVLQGNYYEAEAIVAAYDSKASMDAVINGGSRISSKDGIVPIRVPAGSLGKQTVRGTLYVKTEDGEKPYTFEDEYTVIPPTAVVSLTQMNVFYVGVDNPISISVPMVDAKDISVSFDDVSGPGTVKGTITPDPNSRIAGNYIVKVPSQGRATLSIYTRIDGRTQLAGKKEYRCKSIPAPAIEIGKVRGSGVISKEELISAGRFRVRIPDFDFQIPAIKVNSFVMEGLNQRGEFREMQGTSDRFNEDMMDFIRRARQGQRLTISDVRVTTPDGRQHNLSANLIIR
ncbi:gliding motility protein GldM [Bacteroidales bacterium OttesenSCG-928-C19]|nr:gliding motility protein GldM [Bacteroidales bacterium OttesenSCG-928-C19]